MKVVQCYELFGEIALNNHGFIYIYGFSKLVVIEKALVTVVLSVYSTMLSTRLSKSK